MLHIADSQINRMHRRYDKNTAFYDKSNEFFCNNSSMFVMELLRLWNITYNPSVLIPLQSID